MKEALKSLFSGYEEGLSIKAVIALLGTFFLCLTLFANSFLGDQYYPSDDLVDAVKWIVIAAMFANTWDFFQKRQNTPKQPKSDQ